MKVLVTGGLGYIGSHTVIELIKNNHEVVIIDNLSNSELSVLSVLEKLTNKKLPFYKMDVKDEEIKKVFEEHKIEGIIHFAGYKAVGESVSEPLMYYQNNIGTTLNLVKLALKYKVPKFIFSSSATVYGDQQSPFDETMPRGNTTNPYGETKKINERILEDVAYANKGFNVVLLRYFNPIGAHKSGLIGEKPVGIPNNLMPYITQTAKGIREKLYVFGNDYNTIDGTGVRDYIHVVDLAKGHVKALEYNNKGVDIINLGTGRGTSVLELVTSFEEVNKIKIPYEITNRRPGDIDECYASIDKARKVLKFEAKLTIEDMVRDAWNFEKNLK
ncbi:MAG: UDP-glucose 4-epimerase GalE [Acholeplasmataceae bacterium]|jgi:UDP-glucose 4-epimerase|nr:UDP-glucose 4-epimerase GalE [Acholeplasmataceae bacterium]